MTKKDLKARFNGLISAASIKQSDDGWEVCGKWCHISPVDDLWDIWLVASKRKLSHILKGLPWDFHVVDGEAWVQIKNPLEILPYLRILGIRKKRKGGNVENLRLGTS